jgi:hypothetical protein
MARALAGPPKLRGRALAAGPILARNMGIELETSKFEVDTAVPAKKAQPKSTRIPAKGAPVAHGRDFQLQSEALSDSSRGLEFVTNPPGMPTLADWMRHAHDIAQMASEVEKRKNQTFNASILSGGDPRYEIEGKGQNLDAHVQVTLGVPLAGIPKLFELLSGKAQPTKPTTKLAVMNQGTIGGAVDAKNQVQGGLQNALGLAQAPSGELLGLVTLIEHYLVAGNAQDVKTFPKAAVPVMTRTSFHRAFRMLPQAERQAIGQSMQQWIAALDTRTANAQQKGKSRVFGQTFYDQQSATPPVRLGTTVSQWLRNMPHRDLLTPQGATHRLMAGMDPMRFGPQPPTFIAFLQAKAADTTLSAHQRAQYQALTASVPTTQFLAANVVTGETAMAVLGMIWTTRSG